MAALVQVEANHLLDATWGTAAYSAPTAPVKIALITTTTPSTATAAGSEAAGGSYARQSVTMASSSAGANSNTNAQTYTNMPAATIGGIEQWDSAGTPVRRLFGTLAANKTTNSGDTFTIAIGSLTSSMA